MPAFMPICRRIGPLTMSTGPTGMVVASSPCMLNSSVHAASSAVSTTGRYSGAQPGAGRARARERLPLLATPADDAVDLTAVVADEEQRRHRLDVVVIRVVEVLVELHRHHPRRERWVVLRDHRQFEFVAGIELL